MNPLIYLHQCESTNSSILDYLQPDHLDFLAVYTGCQTKGRGQYGNVWQSGNNINLAYSLGIKCSSIHYSAQTFNFHTAVLSRRFIDKLTDAKVEIKWPNDLIMNNKKISGMLVEKIRLHGVEYYIFGIGINLLQKDFPDLSSAGSLWTQTGKSFGLKEVAVALHEFLCTHLSFCTSEEILQEFNCHLFRKKSISVFEINGIRQNGIIQSVDLDGFLWVELEHNGLKKFAYKELKLLY